MSWIPIFSLNITFGRITLMCDDAQVSERCAIDERKKGGLTPGVIPLRRQIFYSNVSTLYIYIHAL